MPGADNRDVHSRICEGPPDRDLGHAAAALACERLKGTHDAKVLREFVALEDGARAAPIARRTRGSRIHVAREQPMGEWPVGQHSDVLFTTIWKDVHLYRTVEQVIWWL